jgi:predicted nuclease of predicted toxin-antitoxin system
LAVRVLIDENLPRQLARELVGHDAKTVPQMGWASLKNGALLAAMASAGFEALVTMDKNLAKEQRVAELPFGIVVVRAKNNQVATLQPLAPEIRRVLSIIQPGQVLAVGQI